MGKGKNVSKQRESTAASIAAASASRSATAIASSSRFGGGGGFVPAFGGSAGTTTGSTGAGIGFGEGEGHRGEVLDAEVAQLIRHLTKRDITTKLKALRALRTHFEEDGSTAGQGSDDAAVDAWLGQYGRVSVDPNRRVRSAAHGVMLAVAERLGKRLAKHLKNGVFCVWWNGRFDPAREVSAPTNRGFEKIFASAKKRKDALILCSKEFCDMFSEQMQCTLEKISSAYRIAVEEATEVYVVTIAGSLRGLAAAFQALSFEESTTTTLEYKARVAGCRERLNATFEELLVKTGSKKFELEKYLHNSNSDVRRSAYSLMSSVANAAEADMLDGLLSKEAKLSGTILGRLGDKEPITHGEMFNMILVISKKLPDVWNRANASNAILPRFWSLLRHTFYGSAQESAFNLLPLLALMPKALVSDISIGLELLKSTWTGLNKAVSVGDSDAMMQALYECTIYLLKATRKFVDENVTSVSEYRKRIVEDFVVDVLGRSALCETKNVVESERAAALITNVMKSCWEGHIDGVQSVSDDVVRGIFRHLLQFSVSQLEGSTSSSGRIVPLLSRLGAIESLGDVVIQELAGPVTLKAWNSLGVTSEASADIEDMMILDAVVQSYGCERLCLYLSKQGIEVTRNDIIIACCRCAMRQDQHTGIPVRLMYGILAAAGDISGDDWIDLLKQNVNVNPEDDSTGRQAWITMYKLLVGEAIRNIEKKNSFQSIDWLRSEYVDDFATNIVVDNSATSANVSMLQSILRINDDKGLGVLSTTALTDIIGQIVGLLAETSSSEEAAETSLVVVDKLGEVLWQQCATNVPLMLPSLVSIFFRIAAENSHAGLVEAVRRTWDIGVSEEKIINLNVDVRSKAFAECIGICQQQSVVQASAGVSYDFEIISELVCSMLLNVCISFEEREDALDIAFRLVQWWPSYLEINGSGGTLKAQSDFGGMVANSTEALACTILTKDADRRPVRYFLSRIVGILGIDISLGGELAFRRSWAIAVFAIHLAQRDVGIIAKAPEYGCYAACVSDLECAFVMIEYLIGWYYREDCAAIMKGLSMVVEEVIRRCGKPACLKVLVRLMSSRSDTTSASMADGVIETLTPIVMRYVRGMDNICMRSDEDSSDADDEALARISTQYVALWANEAKESEHGSRLLALCFPAPTAQLCRAVEDVKVLIKVPEGASTDKEREMLLQVLRHGIMRLRSSKIALATAQRLGNTTMTESQADSIAPVLLLANAVYCWGSLKEEEWKIVIEAMTSSLDSLVVGIEEQTEAIAAVTMDVFASGGEPSRGVISAALKVAVVGTPSQYVMTELAAWINSIPLYGSMTWQEERRNVHSSCLRMVLASGAMEALAMRSRSVIVESRRMCAKMWECVATVAQNAATEVTMEALEASDAWSDDIGADAATSLFTLLGSAQSPLIMRAAVFAILAKPDVQCRYVASFPQTYATDENDDKCTPVEESDESEAEHLRASAGVCKAMHRLLLIDPPDVDAQAHTTTTTTHALAFMACWGLLLLRLRDLDPIKSMSSRQTIIQYMRALHPERSLFPILLNFLPLGDQKRDEREALRLEPIPDLGKSIQGLFAASDAVNATAGYGLYVEAVRFLPTCAREWFGQIRDKRVIKSLGEIMEETVSPALMKAEMTAAKYATESQDDLIITASNSGREVTAEYKIDESSLQMTIRLPTIFPLRPVEVECTKRVGVSEGRLRKWLLSITAFLRNKDGAILDAIELWRRNVEKEFEGIEECPICYSIIHTTNHSLPKTACKTCRHKFHASCLYKWFSSSHKSTCPLCQTPF